MEDISFVEDALKRIHSHKGVKGSVIVNADGIPIRTTLEHDETIEYAALATQLTGKARGTVKSLDAGAALDSEDELQVLRVRSKKQEVIITPVFEKGRAFTLIVIQEPSAHQPPFTERAAEQ